MRQSAAKHYWVFLIIGLVLGAGLVQLRAAEPAKSARVFEIRTYHCFPGRLDALHQRFREHTMKMFEKHGMTNVGYWVPVDNPDNKLIYLLAFPSREARANAWKAFLADPEWKKISDASQVDGKIVERVESVFMDATDYSPLK